MNDREATSGLLRLRSRPLSWLVLTLLAVGFLTRLIPLFDQGGRLLQQYPTEDGYLMLTIARNFAIGKGFSVADGTIPTNGTQPLITLVWTLCFLLAGGDRTGGVAIALVVQLAFSLVAAYAVFRLGLRVFAERESKREMSALAASAWYASPLVIPHSMNCLETGFYAGAAAAVAYVFVESEEERRTLWSVKKCLLVGLLLGATFWIRNDSVFLILAACLVHLYVGLPSIEAVKKRFGRALIFGGTSVVVALPWLIFNYTQFGSIMPVSGRAESLTGTFASNLYYLPPVLTEYVMLVLPIPEVIQQRPYAVVACSVFLVGVLPPLTLLSFGRGTRTERTLIVLTGIFGAGLIIFYGLFFGAYWFLARYMFPLSGLIAVGWGALALHLHQRLSRAIRPVALAAPVLMVGVVVGLHIRAYLKGDKHMHFQVVRWVQEHVPEETWVGAIQTGTLGYFHDRTINLDGKVNVYAYNALVESRIADYVVDETEIEYLADWMGMLDWRTMTRIDENFEVVVADYGKNLAVLQRKSTGTSTTAEPR